MIAINHGTSKYVLTLPQTGSQFRGVKLAVEESDSNRISRSSEILGHKQNVRPVLNAYRKYEITLMFTVWYFLILT